MKVVRFLEREKVIRFFGVALITVPFLNLFLHLWVLKSQSKVLWSQVNILAFLKSGNSISYILAACSIFIGFKMLSGSTKAWRYVMVLIGAHLLIQIINVNNKAWQGPLAWPSFLFNTALLFFIIDQLVWKVNANAPAPVDILKKDSQAGGLASIFTKKQVVNLKSYRKILFSFGSTKPWGELKTLSSEELCVKSFSLVPDNVEKQIIQINFAKDVIVEIKFNRRENEMYYFKPLNMQKEDVVRLNLWLKKIAV